MFSDLGINTRKRTNNFERLVRIAVSSSALAFCHLPFSLGETGEFSKALASRGNTQLCFSERTTSKLQKSLLKGNIHSPLSGLKCSSGAVMQKGSHTASTTVSATCGCSSPRVFCMTSLPKGGASCFSLGSQELECFSQELWGKSLDAGSC